MASDLASSCTDPRLLLSAQLWRRCLGPEDGGQETGLFRVKTTLFFFIFIFFIPGSHPLFHPPQLLKTMWHKCLITASKCKKFKFQLYPTYIKQSRWLSQQRRPYWSENQRLAPHSASFFFHFHGNHRLFLCFRSNMFLSKEHITQLS